MPCRFGSPDQSTGQQYQGFSAILENEQKSTLTSNYTNWVTINLRVGKGRMGKGRR